MPAKKELGQILRGNALISEEKDATLLFALLHRLGLLWSREGRVDTLLPAVMAQSPRWVAERAFAKLLEDDLKLWNMPPAEDRHFLMQHLLERKGQILSIQPFLRFSSDPASPGCRADPNRFPALSSAAWASW